MTTVPEVDRWTLVVRFDPPAVQENISPELVFPYDECSRLIAFIGKNWDLLPEDLKEIVTWDATSATLQLDQLDFVTAVMQWLGDHTVPQSVTLTRNEPR